MNMESVTHSYLCKLRIISKIPTNGKIDTTHNNLNIYYGGLFGWLYRKAYGDNKEHATKYLSDLYREINSFSDQLMYNISTEQNEIRRRKKISMLVSLAEKMKESLTGIRNLIGTYTDYLEVVSLLECLEQDIIIPQYRILLKFIPESCHTEILKTEITHSHIHTIGMFGNRERSFSEADVGEIKTVMESVSETYSIPVNSDKINNAKSAPIDIPNKKNKKNTNISYATSSNQ